MYEDAEEVAKRIEDAVGSFPLSEQPVLRKTLLRAYALRSSQDASTQTPSQSALEAHKREAFDGMKRYHESELAHKRDTVTILSGLLGGAAAAYAALLVPQQAMAHAVTISWILFVAVLVTCAMVLAAPASSFGKTIARIQTMAPSTVRRPLRLGWNCR